MELYEKVLGAILGAGIGDAMGAPFRTKPHYLICPNKNYIYDYTEPKDYWNFGMESYRFTDVFSIAYANIRAYLKEGSVTDEATKQSLLEWSKSESYKYYRQFMGPTTKIGISRLDGSFDPNEWSNDLLLRLPCDQFGITSGASSKAWVSGIFSNNNEEHAIENVITQCRYSHDNVLALSGAGAIALAMNEAMKENSTVKNVILKSIEGAAKAYEKNICFARDAAGATIENRISLGVEIGEKYKNDFENLTLNMADIVGTGFFASETVGSAMGFVSACDGDVMRSIYAAINSGNNTSAIASICGAICGALKGYKEIPDYKKHIELLEEANGFSIEKTALEITELLLR